MQSGNLCVGLPDRIPEEIFETLLEAEHFRIERIVSRGQATPGGTWYDQDDHEWVLVLQGRATLNMEGEAQARLMQPGDWIAIPAHRRHRVEWTDPDQTTIWLAVHYG